MTGKSAGVTGKKHDLLDPTHDVVYISNDRRSALMTREGVAVKRGLIMQGTLTGVLQRHVRSSLALMAGWTWADGYEPNHKKFDRYIATRGCIWPSSNGETAVGRYHNA